MPYTIRRSARARRVRVTVDNDGTVVVTLPQRAPERRAAEAVRELRPWIDRRLRALSRAADELARTPGTVPYLGEDAEARAAARPRARAPPRRVPAVPERRRGGGAGALVPPPGAGGDRAAAGRGGRPRRHALPGAHHPRPAHALGLVLLHGRDVVQLAAPARAPEAVLDYVIEHEVCHLEVMDHSPRFWALLASRVPGWREPAAWLRRYGSTLVLPDSTRAQRRVGVLAGLLLDDAPAHTARSTPPPSRRRGRRRRR